MALKSVKIVPFVIALLPTSTEQIDYTNFHLSAFKKKISAQLQQKTFTINSTVTISIPVRICVIFNMKIMKVFCN